MLKNKKNYLDGRNRPGTFLIYIGGNESVPAGSKWNFRITKPVLFINFFKFIDIVLRVLIMS